MKLLKTQHIIMLIDKAVTILGIAFIFFGIYQIYPPAAWIVFGTILAFPDISGGKAVK